MDKNIKRVSVHIDDFLLWHNNPRLIEEFGEERPIEAVEAAQEEITERLRGEAEVRELVKSILSNGWLGYDTILVAEHETKNGKKYVVLEGNRRITSLKIIVENARKGFKNVQGYGQYQDISNFEDQIKDGIECYNVGDYSNLPKDIEDLVDRILNIRHIIGQKQWPLHRKSFKVFKDYMNLLMQEDPSVISTEPKSFYIDEDVIKRLASFMGEKTPQIKRYLYIYRLRHQLGNHLADLGAAFPKEKTSYLEEFLAKPDLTRRYGFDTENGTISRGELLDRFCKVHFEYPGNTPPVRSASAGDYSLRHYAYVVKHDRSPEEKYIKQIEEEQKMPREVAGEVATINSHYALEDGLEKISKLIEKLDIRDIRIEQFDNDQIRFLTNNIVKDFKIVEKQLKEWEKENK